MSKTIKLAKGEPISFKYTTSITLDITDEPITVSDHVAAEAKERFGEYIEVTDAPDLIPVVEDPQDETIPVIDPLPSVEATVDPVPPASADTQEETHDEAELDTPAN